MSRKWKIAILILIFLVGGGYLSLRSDFILEPVKKLVLNSLVSRLPWPVEVEQISLSIIPSSLTLHNVKVLRSENERVPMLETKEISISFSPWSLLTEVTIVKKIQVKEPHLVMIPMEGWAKSPQPSIGKSEKIPSVPFRRPTVVVIRRIDLINGTVNLESGTEDMGIQIGGAHVSIIPDLDMREFQVHVETGQTSIRSARFVKDFTRMKADLTIDRNTIQIRHGSLEAPEVNFTVEGNIKDLKDPVYTMTVEGSFPVSELEPYWNLKGTAKGKIHIHADLAGSPRVFTASGQTTVHDFTINGLLLGEAKSGFRFADHRLLLSNIESLILNGTVRADASIDLTPSPPSYQMTLEGKSVSAGPIATLLGYPGLLRDHIIDGTIEAAGQGADRRSLTAQGILNISSNTEILTPPSDTKSRLEWINRIKNISGKITLAKGILTVEEGFAQSALSRAQFQGSLGPQDHVEAEFQVVSQEIHEISPLLKIGFIRGAAEINGVLLGRIEKPQWSANGIITNATVRGRPFESISGKIDFSPPNLTLSNVVFKEGPSTYVIEGVLSFNPSFTVRPFFDFNATITDGLPREVVALFYRELPITAKASGSLKAKGNRKKFDVAAHLTVGPGKIYGQELDRGRLDLIVTHKKVSFLNVTAKQAQSTLSGGGWIQYNGHFEVNATSPETYVQDISWAHGHLPQVEAMLAGTIRGGGKLKNPSFDVDFTLKDFRYQGQSYGNGTLSTKVKDKKMIVVTGLDSGLSARATLILSSPFPFELRTSLNDFQAAPVILAAIPSIPEWAANASAETWGQFNADGTLENLDRGSFSLRLNRINLNVSDYALSNDGDIEINIENGRVDFLSAALIGEGTHFNVGGGIELGKSYDLLVTGEVDLDLLRSYTQEVPIARGKATATVQIQDRWDDPVIRGHASLKEGRIKSETFNQFITIKEMELSFDKRRVILDSFEGIMGGGKLSASGKWDLKGFSADKFDLNLELEAVRITAIQGLTGSVNASLLYQGTQDTKSLIGEILVQRAVYNRRINWKRFVLDLLKNQGGQKNGSGIGKDVNLNIQVLGKDNIRINNNLADIPLEMDFLLKGTIEKPVLLGRMEAKGGTILFRRNDFKIESGSVDFIDPNRIRPIFDISANTRVRSFEINLTLVGPLDRFELGLTSNPPLADHEILALLTFGQTPEEINDASAEVIAGGQAIDLLTGDIQFAVEEQAQKIGIDRFQVDPFFSAGGKSAGTPRVTVSKHLWEDTFYVTYITTFDASGEDIAEMEYILDEHMSLVGRRDELGRISGDLKFRFEFR